MTHEDFEKFNKALSLNYVGENVLLNTPLFDDLTKHLMEAYAVPLDEIDGFKKLTHRGRKFISIDFGINEEIGHPFDNMAWCSPIMVRNAKTNQINKVAKVHNFYDTLSWYERNIDNIQNDKPKELLSYIGILSEEKILE